MNYSTYRFTLDIHKTKSQVSIPVLFQDTGAQIYINLTDGGKPYHIAEGCRAVLYGKKPLFHSDTGKYDTLIEDCEIIDGGTRIRYAFSDQTTTQLGSVACEIRLYSKDGKLLTTPAFEILVEARVIEDDEIIESADERTALDRIFESETSRETAEEARDEAERARAEAERERVNAEEQRLVEATNKIKDLAVLLKPKGWDNESVPPVQEIYGSIRIKGGLKVDGDYSIIEANVLRVENKFIICNSGGISDVSSGLVMVTGDGEMDDAGFFRKYPAYGILYDSVSDTVRLGKGTFKVELTSPDTSFGTFAFNAGEDEAVATRGDEIGAGELLQWDEEKKMLVGSGKKASDFVNRVETDGETQTIMGDLSVTGRFHAGTLLSKGKFIACNFYRDGNYNKALSGLVFPSGTLYVDGDADSQPAYAITFDPDTESLRLGQGVIRTGIDFERDKYFDFTYDEVPSYGGGELQDQAIATRADDIADGNIPQWDDEKKMFVDSGKNINSIGSGVTEEVVDKKINDAIGDISTALDEIIALGEFYTGATFDELHEYAINVAKGGSQ